MGEWDSKSTISSQESYICSDDARWAYYDMDPFNTGLSQLSSAQLKFSSAQLRPACALVGNKANESRLLV